MNANAPMRTADATSNIVAAVSDSAEQFLTFQVGEAEYGVDLMSVREIKGWTEATRLPNTPDFMRGVINLRGAIIPIFDLRCRFGQGLTLAQAKNVVVILNISERNIGLLVDAVSDIVAVEHAEIKNAPQESGQSIDDRFVRGLISHGGRMVVLLDVERLFDANTLQIADRTAQPSNAN